MTKNYDMMRFSQRRMNKNRIPGMKRAFAFFCVTVIALYAKEESVGRLTMCAFQFKVAVRLCTLEKTLFIGREFTKVKSDLF